MRRTARTARWTIDEVSDLCGSGHRLTRRLLYDFGVTIGAALGTACVVLNPDAIVVDGTRKNAVNPIIDGLRHGIERHAPTAATDNLAILPGELYEDAAIWGALALANERIEPQ
jgi:predicted NBD/HSP70 family sugar kinase